MEKYIMIGPDWQKCRSFFFFLKAVVSIIKFSILDLDLNLKFFAFIIIGITTGLHPITLKSTYNYVLGKIISKEEQH